MPPVPPYASWQTAPPRRIERGGWYTSGSDHADPFAVNPIRRSFGLVVVSAAMLLGPFAIGGEPGITSMIAGGWMGMIGLAIGVPVLALSLLEYGWERLRRSFDPGIDDLDISPRLINILHRHGYDSISVVEATPDAALLLLSNMDLRGLREVRRAIAQWRYLRWQAAGFP